MADHDDHAAARIERARAVDSTTNARHLYDVWAADYDADVFDRMGVTGSARVADLLAARMADRAAMILDVGCGTGAVGGRLVEHGFDDIVGVDLSPGMLSVAGERAVYRSLLVADLQRPPFRDGAFDATVSAGTFLSGHLGADSVRGLVALLRPGAVVAWSVTPTVWPEIRRALTAAGVTIETEDLEPIRANADDDGAHFVVGALPS